MSSVTMRHPSLPKDQLVEVPESAVPHHRAAGWEVVDDTPASPKPPAPAEASAEPTAPKRRRAAPKESD